MKKLSFYSIAFVVFITATSYVEITAPVSSLKTIEDILTEKAWKAEEIRVQQADGMAKYYKRGGSSNTVDYDTDLLKFNRDHTGMYYYSGEQYKTTWRFMDENRSKMTLVIYFYTPLTIHLENINITGNTFKYSQYINAGKDSYLASCTRTTDRNEMDCPVGSGTIHLDNTATNIVSAF